MDGDWRSAVACGALPTRHLLRAALRAARVLPEAGVAEEVARHSYGAIPSGGVFTSSDLHAGEAVLVSAALLERHAGTLVPSGPLLVLRALPNDPGCDAIICALLEEVRPVWLIAATSDGILEPEMIPDQAVRELAHLDPAEREGMLLGLGRKFSSEDREQTGALAEEALCEAFRQELIHRGAPHLAPTVRRVSLVSDALGYDLTTPRLAGGVLRVESKGTRGSGPIWRVFITRNEARQADADPDWVLVVSSVSPVDEVEVVGWLAGADVRAFLPKDAERVGLWETAELWLSGDALTPGLPDV